MTLSTPGHFSTPGGSESQSLTSGVARPQAAGRGDARRVRGSRRAVIALGIALAGLAETASGVVFLPGLLDGVDRPPPAATSASPTPSMVPGATATARHAPSADDPATIALPLLHGDEAGCAPQISVQNVDTEPAVALLLLWEASNGCGPAAAAAGAARSTGCGGISAAFCSGLLAPGGAWTFDGHDLEGRSSGLVLSLSGTHVIDDGLEEVAISKAVCERALAYAVGDCDESAKFLDAYRSGTLFHDLPLDQAWGGALAVNVHDACTDDAGTVSHAAYTGIQAPGMPGPGGHTSVHLADVRGGGGVASTLHIQALSSECTGVSVWYAPEGCAGPRLCDSFQVSAGAAAAYDVAGCAAGPGSVRVDGSGPIAVVAETHGSDYRWEVAGEARSNAEPDGSGDPHNPVTLIGPLSYAPSSGWHSEVVVQNLSATEPASVTVKFRSGSGDVDAFLGAELCPGGSHLFVREEGALGDPPLESVWVSGSAAAGGPEAPALVGSVALTRSGADDPGGGGAAMSYRLLGEGEVVDGPVGHGPGGLASGNAAIAIPRLEAAGDGIDQTTLLAVTDAVDVPGFTVFLTQVYDPNGLLDVVCETLNQGHTEYMDVATWGYVAPGFRGSAIISAVYWDHPVYDDRGEFVRNLVGLGAVAVSTSGLEGDTGSAVEGVALPSVPVAIDPRICGEGTRPPPDPF